MQGNEQLNTHHEAEASLPVRQKIERVVARLAHGEVTLAVLLERVGGDSLMLLSILLALVFLAPVSIPGVSTVFGAAILLIGVAQLFDRPLWLPGRIAHRPIPAERLRPALARALAWLERVEKVSRPCRLPALAAHGRANRLAFVLAAVLLMAPLGLIPFSNTLPALAVIFFALGAIQKDGGSVLLGHASNLASLAYFGALFAGGGLAAYEAWMRLLQ